MIFRIMIHFIDISFCLIIQLQIWLKKRNDFGIKAASYSWRRIKNLINNKNNNIQIKFRAGIYE